MEFTKKNIYMMLGSIENYSRTINEVLYIKNTVLRSNARQLKQRMIEYFDPRNKYYVLEKFEPFENQQINFIDKRKMKTRFLTYSNLFVLTEKDLNLKYLDSSWDLKFWLNLLPKFQINTDCVHLNLLNSLIAISTECVRCINQGIKEDDGTLVKTRWDELNSIIDTIERNIEVGADKIIIMNDNVYKCVSILSAGILSHYRGLDLTIYTPVFKPTSSHLKNIYELFDDRRNDETIKYVFHNFVRDTHELEIKFNSGTFTGPDTKISLTTKMVFSIVNRSDKNINKILKQLVKFMAYTKTIKDEKVIEESELSNDVEFKVLSKRQTSVVKSFAMCILTELFYGDRIKMLIKVDKQLFMLWDSLVNYSVDVLSTGFIGGDNIEGNEMFKFFKLIDGNVSVPFIRQAYLNKRFCLINGFDFNDHLFRLMDY